MQYVRRVYKKYGEINYPTVLEYQDIYARVLSLIRSNHAYMKNASNHPLWFESMFEEENLLGNYLSFFLLQVCACLVMAIILLFNAL